MIARATHPARGPEGLALKGPGPQMAGPERSFGGERRKIRRRGTASVPPTLAAPSDRALTCGLHAILRPAAYGGQLEDQVERLYPGSLPFAFASGRIALAAAIRMAMRATGRTHVVLPAYTSFSVASAAAAAQARVRLCDVDPTTLDFDRSDLQACIDDRVAAVVLGNLYGYPSSLAGLEFLPRRGVVVIDDAAQAVGATEEGRRVGSRGQVGVLSFGRGKCATIGSGGVLLLHEKRLRPYLAAPPTSSNRGIAVWLIAALVRLSAHRRAFDLLSRVPGARIGASVYEPRLPVRGLSSAAQGLAVDLGTALARHLRVRRRVAALWQRALPNGSPLSVVRPVAGARPAYLRLPALATTHAEREAMIRRLAAVGFRFVRSYPTPLDGIPEFKARFCERRAIPKARRIGECLLALPCHGGLTREDVQRAGELLSRPAIHAGVALAW